MIRENNFNAKSRHRLPHNFRVDSRVFKNDEPKTEVKTNSGHRVCPPLVRSSLLACPEHVQSSLLPHYVHIQIHTNAPKPNKQTMDPI